MNPKPFGRISAILSQAEQDKDRITHIYADLKWAMKIRVHTTESIIELIDNAIKQCATSIKDEHLCYQAITGFQAMKERLQTPPSIPTTITGSGATSGSLSLQSQTGRFS